MESRPGPPGRIHAKIYLPNFELRGSVPVFVPFSALDFCLDWSCFPISFHLPSVRVNFFQANTSLVPKREGGGDIKIGVSVTCTFDEIIGHLTINNDPKSWHRHPSFRFSLTWYMDIHPRNYKQKSGSSGQTAVFGRK
jgi:hypothetical protein